MRVCIIGGGNWGTTIARLIARNVSNLPSYCSKVKMWVLEEEVDGEKLTDIINTRHENIKYLPGIKLPREVIAVSDIREAAEDADVIVFVVPHQFVESTCIALKDSIKPTAIAVSLTKGFVVRNNEIRLASREISESLNVDTSVLMGANIAKELAADLIAEGTPGYTSISNAKILFPLFNCVTYRVSLFNDIAGAEVCAVLKNVVALGCGFCDGLRLGSNAKAAVMRNGLIEMIKFCELFYPEVKKEAFFESSGIGDLITTCSSGRNHMCAKRAVELGVPISEVEREEMNGQKLQGTLSASDIFKFLESKDCVGRFLLFATVHKICTQVLEAVAIMGTISPGSLENLERSFG